MGEERREEYRRQSRGYNMGSSLVTGCSRIGREEWSMGTGPWGWLAAPSGECVAMGGEEGSRDGWGRISWEHPADGSTSMQG